MSGKETVASKCKNQWETVANIISIISNSEFCIPKLQLKNTRNKPWYTRLNFDWHYRDPPNRLIMHNGFMSKITLDRSFLSFEKSIGTYKRLCNIPFVIISIIYIYYYKRKYVYVSNLFLYLFNNLLLYFVMLCVWNRSRDVVKAMLPTFINVYARTRFFMVPVINISIDI